MKTKLRESEAAAQSEVLSVLPYRLKGEIERLASGRALGLSGIREIRLRGGAASKLLYENAVIPLSSVTAEQISDIIDRLCDGCAAAHRDTIAEGYISMDFGVRVGVAGSCRYDCGEFVGVGDVSGLVFRMPTGRCEFGEELFSLYNAHAPRGLIIYSPPGVGKTSALRDIAGRLGSGENARFVVVVDERCEFSASDYSSARVDILRGYKKRLGIEIAVRSLSAEIVIADELGAADAEPILDVMRFGVPFIATAHSACAEELYKKPSMRRLFEAGAIDMMIGIERCGAGYKLKSELVC